ncbi:hybrid sensor histidine kinase/response regulator transcription factor [Bacteroides sp.]
MKHFFQTFLILIYCSSCFASQENYYFNHLDIQKGLSQSTIFCIHQDNKGFMWFGTKNGLNKFDGYSFKIYERNNQEHAIGNSTINCIEETPSGDLWIGTDKGIYIFNPYNETFSSFDERTPNNSIIASNVRLIKRNELNEIWILTGTGLFIYNMPKNELISLNEKLFPFSSNPPSSICIDNDNVTWISIPYCGILKYENQQLSSFYTNTKDNIVTIENYQNSTLLAGTSSSGVIELNKINNESTFIKLSDSGIEPLIHTICPIKNQNIWIGTESGVYIYDQKNIVNLSHKPSDQYSLSDNAIYSIYQDKNEGIWIGSYFGGIDYLPKQVAFFEKYYPIANNNSISGNRVREFIQDGSGNLWIATEDAGLNYFDTKNKTFTHYSTDTRPLSLSYYNVQCLNLHNDQLWIGFYHKGIDVLDLKSKKIKHYEKTNQENSLDNNDIFSIYTDRTGQTWIGTSTGVLLYNKEKDNFINCKDIGTFFISDIYEDANGYLWFATYNIGVIRLNPRTKEIKKFSNDPKDSTSICYDKITTIFQDYKKQLWFGSEDGGFCLYNEKTETFKCITTKDGLPSNVIHKILEDSNHTLWISTNNGLAHYNPETGEIQNYNTTNGLLSKQFNYNSGIRAEDGTLYFGSINGMTAFNPEDFKENSNQPTVVLTRFQIFNKDVDIRQEGSALKKAIAYTDTILLDYRQSSFNFEFSTLNYATIETNKYAYKLEGVDRDWIYSDNNTNASYSNIKPGKYLFRIKASNSDGKWDNKETCIHIIITPPWWQTPYAHFAYVLILGSIIYSAIHFNIRRIKRRNRKRQRLQERKKQEEIYTAKIDFFTDIAHEIRTPLTLIKAPLDYILCSDVDKQELTDNLQIMKRNTDRLLALINQLLDFRKTESKIFSLKFENTNINELIYNTYIRFKPAMEQKRLDVKLDFPEEPVIASIDKEAITKVCSNLLTNAIKYAATYIHINITPNAEHNYFEIRVDNDGETIPAKFREKIFEAFFQVSDADKSTKSGSGIGLALANSLVQLHKGRIFVDNNLTEYTSFVVQIPINTHTNELIKAEPDAPESVEETAPAIQSEESSESLQKTILIVEDNVELQDFISNKLCKHYKIINAHNGLEALEIIDKERVDLIISDIIMPLMSGIDLCKSIKSNIQICHIPIILLTAKTNLNSKIEGLKSGADAYIEKPFSMFHLEVQISNLLENHENLRKNFASNPFISTNTIARTKTDEQFLNKLTEVITLNLEEENFNVDDLASAVNMSRTSLHRKLKGISELTPGDFIRLVRLRKAAELLQEGEYRINEICILVGFHSQSYFTKSFQKQFGVLPKDFVKKNTNQENKP